MECKLKKIRLMFSSLSSCLGELKKILIMIYSFFANSLDIFLLVFYNRVVTRYMGSGIKGVGSGVRRVGSGSAGFFRDQGSGL